MIEPNSAVGSAAAPERAIGRGGPRSNPASVRKFTDALEDALSPRGARAAESDRPARGTEAAALAASGIDPRMVVRDTAPLLPEFRDRLERVMQRMQDEHGHSVKITETVRHQERQDFLYEQGRTRPGPVVTWTRNSNHAHGRAADVIIDGTYGNPLAYQRLARIAAEEGLRTLGPRDAGHIELPPGTESGASSGGSWAAPSAAVEGRAATAGGAGGIARVAQVAEVARVARVAEVARPGAAGRGAATAAVAGGEGASARPGSAAEKARGAAALQEVLDLVGGRSGSEDRSGPTAIAGLAPTLRRQAAREEESGGGMADVLTAARADELLAQLESAHRSGTGTAGAAAVEGVAQTDAADRIARIVALRDGAAAAPVNHLLLRLDNGAGGIDRIRVDLRGSAVGATIDAGSAEDARLLGRNVDDLQASLDRRGLETDALRIRGPAPAAAADGMDPVRSAVAASDLEAARTSASSRGGGESSRDSSRDPSQDSSQDPSRRDAEDSRNRSRQEHKGRSDQK